MSVKPIGLRIGFALALGWLAPGLLGCDPLFAEDSVAVSPTLPAGPDFKDVLSLATPSRPRISPDGRTIAYTVRTSDWEENRYDVEIWLAPSDDQPFLLTRTDEGSSIAPRWSPDGEWIAFLADRGNDRQIYLIRPRGGEARPLTAIEDGVSNFRWSPDSTRMAVALREAETEPDKQREELYGRFSVEDAEHRMTHLWILDVATALAARDGVEKAVEDETDAKAEATEEEEEEGEEGEEEGEGSSHQAADEEGAGDDGDDEPVDALHRLTAGDHFTVDDFAWSPDGRLIALSHREDTSITAYDSSDLSIVEVATGEIRSLLERPSYDGDPMWSPDGEWILFSTNNESSAYYLNSELAKIPAAGGDVQLLTGAFDENPNVVAWLPDGIRFLAFQKTRRQLFALDPETGTVTSVEGLPPVVWDVDYARGSKALAVLGEETHQLIEVYRRDSEQTQAVAVTTTSEQIAGWPLPQNEVIAWSSRDGTKIEGVLLKPADFEAGRQYPLLVVIHGGPAAVSLPRTAHTYVYPVQQWLAKGALVLMPNYRGSTGYGETFRAKNVRNLGVGDAWDVLSGVDHLIAAGLADPDRLGTMGWSQGGYISAFLATTSDRFKAISVGAGISNWMTYYVNTDIHPFTRHYLQGTPWSDPEIYAKTSPMTYINDAQTPTLIQHGENDRRVPIPNAYELFQGLQDVGVETRLIVYREFGHGITQPKERLAAVWHNWQWFAKYLWGEEVELPLE